MVCKLVQLYTFYTYTFLSRFLIFIKILKFHFFNFPQKLDLQWRAVEKEGGVERAALTKTSLKVSSSNTATSHGGTYLSFANEYSGTCKILSRSYFNVHPSFEVEV